MSDEGAPLFDRARLIADVRKGEPEALRQAYAATFDTELGRLVLAHHLTLCGVGAIRGAAETDQQLRYQAGRHDAALDLALQAGFDAAAIAVGVMTGELEGTTDDPSFNHPERTPAYEPPLGDDF